MFFIIEMFRHCLRRVALDLQARVWFPDLGYSSASKLIIFQRESRSITLIFLLYFLSEQLVWCWFHYKRLAIFSNISFTLFTIRYVLFFYEFSLLLMYSLSKQVFFSYGKFSKTRIMLGERIENVEKGSRKWERRISNQNSEKEGFQIQILM